MAKRKKKEEAAAEDAPQSPEAAAQSSEGALDPERAAELALDPRRADARTPQGAPEGWAPPSGVPKGSRRSSSQVRRNSRAAAAAAAGTAAGLAAKGITDPDVIARATQSAADRAVAAVQEVAAATTAAEPAEGEKKKETKEERRARREAETKAERLAALPEDQRKLVEEGRAKTQEITTKLRGSTVVGGELLARMPGVDIGDVLGRAPALRSSELGVERVKALQDVIPSLPSNSLVTRYQVARNMLDQGLRTERAGRLMFGAIDGTPNEVQKAFDVWSKTSLTNFENPDLFNRHALHAARKDPTLLHDDMLHSIAAAKRAEKGGALDTASPDKDHMNALALARTYGIDAELLSGMDDASISSWNAKRRDVSGIRPDLHESLRDAAPEEITQRIADLDAGQIPQNLLNQYTKKATDKFLELQSTGAGMSPQDMANVAHNHALSSMREAVRPRSREEMLQKLRTSELAATNAAPPPVSMRLTPKQFAGLTEEAIAQAMEAEGLEVTPTASEASLSEMMYKKGRSPKSGEDTRPLYARDYPELDISGLAPDLQKQLRSGDPDEVSKAIDEVTKRMEQAEALGISVPELLGQREKTSITGYDTGELSRIPSKHYIKDPHTGALTPHGITTGGVGQYDIDALNQMGRVDVLAEDDPSRIHTDKSGQKHVMTHVFTPDPRKVTLIPSGRGNLAIQRHVTQSAESHRRRPDLPTSVGAQLEEHQADVEAMMHVEDYSGSAKKDTRAAAAANIPGSALEQRKASNKAMRLDERAQELIDSDVSAQDEVDRALFEERQSAAAESGQVIGGQFKSVATRIPLSEARQRVMSDIFAKDDIKEQAKRQDPVYQQDMADYQAEMAKRRENPLVSGIESLRDTSASVSQKAVRLADEASNLITRGIPRDQVINFLSTAHESSPIFNDISEEHHPLIKGMAIHKLNEVHNLGIRGAELSGMNLSNADVSPARGANEVFDVLRSRLPEDHPMKTAIGSNASGTRGQVIDQNLLIPSFEEWRKPKLQTRSMERAVAGMFRGGPVEPKVAPKVNEAELNRRSEESRAEANRLIAAIPPPRSMGSAMTNLPPQRGGSAFQPASSFAPGTPLMEFSDPSRTSVNRGMPMDSAALRGEISQASSTHRGMIANAIQARSNMAKFNDNMRQHQSMLARADEFDRRASSTPNPKLAAQHKSEAGNIRSQAEAHFKATGLHMSPEEHRANYESMKSQAIEHSRNEGLTARGYAQSSGEAEFFFR